MEEVGDAHPEIRKAVETMVVKGKWTVPGKLSVFYTPSDHASFFNLSLGYKEKFGELSVM